MLDYVTNIIETARARSLERNIERHRPRIIREFWVDLDEISIEFTDGEEIEINTEDFVEYYNDINQDVKPAISLDNIPSMIHGELILYLKHEMDFGHVDFL